MDVLEWLGDVDPSIRWQTMVLSSEPDDVVSAERSLVATDGWGAELLAIQDETGHWDGGTYRPGWVDDSKPFFDAWTATHYSLQLLRLLGVDPDDKGVKHAISLVRDNVFWRANDAPYFDGETEPCVNGIALDIGSYFGQDVDRIVDRLLEDQLGDGGWNCWAVYGATRSSFHTTICVIEGLASFEKHCKATEDVTAARITAQDHLLERGLMRGLRSGEIIDPRFTMFSFPYYWYYDVLRALDHFSSIDANWDERMSEAVDLVVNKRDETGRWPLENVHQGPTHFSMDGVEDDPSRWNTLRALRVLGWAGIA